MFAAIHLATPATVASDGRSRSRATTLVEAGHGRSFTCVGKASSKVPQFRGIKTLLRNPKTAITGTYHALGFAKYAHRYLAEFPYRFNRRFNMKTLLPCLLAAVVGAPRSSERLLFSAEASR